ncbi:hypothetical protein GLW05_11770 [Pontibacillus yanchengensis]|uniref:SbsA Ig-like domain-containing protein n=1 Tax=Pontibacillus yanchengensis TaxID=462910 RepID=A0A6I4ZZ89_9BACI|nr:Ig-like domain-containing protein [Pontibacillus yanchengensis]MYL34276.1 hypothetical protein [Pontibacillus yanchengensis]
MESANNLKEVTVEFNNENFDMEEVENTDNYDLGDDLSVEEVTVDGSTATLTLEEAADNQTDATLTINEVVTGEEVEKDLTFFDTTVPETTGASVVGKNTVKVEFTEPINFEATEVDGKMMAASKYEDEFEITMGSKTYVVDDVEVLENGNAANVKVFGSFDEGDLKVDVMSGLEDFAGFNVVSESFDIDVEEDTEAPEVVEYKNATRESVTLVFNEDIQQLSDDPEDFYHTNDNNNVGSIDNVKVSGNELTLEFPEDSLLPEGTAYVYVAGEAIADLWDNENEQQVRQEVQVELDETAPEVDDVSASADEVEITFSETVEEDSAQDEDNYKILDGNGDEVDVVRRAELNNDGDTVTLNLDEDLTDGNYTLWVDGVQDKAGNSVDEFTSEFSLDDESAPDFPSSALLENLSDGTDAESKLIVEYDESMTTDGEYSVLDLSKYELYNQSDDSLVGNLAKLDNNADYDVSIDATDDNQVVEITIDGLDVEADTHYLKIARVADEDGNFTDNFSSGVIDIKDVATEGISFDSVDATSTEELNVEFDSTVDDFEEDDFMVFYGTQAQLDSELSSDDDLSESSNTYAISSLEPTGSNTAKLGLATAIDADANVSENEAFLVAVGNETENRYGVNLTQGSYQMISDEIAPSIDDDNVDATYDNTTDQSTITFSFDEEVKASLINASTFEVNGGDNEILRVDTNTPASGKTEVTLTVSGQIYEDDFVTQTAPIYDTSDNKVTGLEVDVDEETTGDIPTTGSVAFGQTIYNDEETATITVNDKDQNTDNSTKETVDVTVDDGNGASTTVTLTETGNATGEFTGELDFDVDFTTAADGTLTVTYDDTEDETGSDVDATDTATYDVTAPTASFASSSDLTNVVLDVSEDLQADDGADLKSKFDLTDAAGSDLNANVVSAMYDKSADTITVTIENPGDTIADGDNLDLTGTLNDVAGNEVTQESKSVADESTDGQWEATS